MYVRTPPHHGGATIHDTISPPSAAPAAAARAPASSGSATHGTVSTTITT